MDTPKTTDKDFSFEFFPPKTAEGDAKLQSTWETLARFKPKFFSVTFGAGGSTRDRTYETVRKIQSGSGIAAAPHLSCVGSTKANIQAILQQYKDVGISRLVCLRGDMPSGMQDPGELRHANELVALIRQATGPYFHIEVAAYPEYHPQAKTPATDLHYFKMKIDAGANSALTQYFFNMDAYDHFVNRCEKLGIHVPIVPGIMPITNYRQLARFSDMCGAEIPRWIRLKLEHYGDDLESIRQFGMDVTINLCRRLLDNGAPGLHIYTMNRADASVEIWQALNLAG